MKNLLPILAIAIGFTIIVLLFDMEIFNCTIYNRIVYTTDSTFKIPSPYKLLYSKKNRDYIISNSTDLGIKYLTTLPIDGIHSFWETTQAAVSFNDSNRAKGYLKAYLEQTNPEYSYKEIGK